MGIYLFPSFTITYWENTGTLRRASGLNLKEECFVFIHLIFSFIFDCYLKCMRVKPFCFDLFYPKVKKARLKGKKRCNYIDTLCVFHVPPICNVVNSMKDQYPIRKKTSWIRPDCFCGDMFWYKKTVFDIFLCFFYLGAGGGGGVLLYRKYTTSIA